MPSSRMRIRVGINDLAGAPDDSKALSEELCRTCSSRSRCPSRLTPALPTTEETHLVFEGELQSHLADYGSPSSELEEGDLARVVVSVSARIENCPLADKRTAARRKLIDECIDRDM